MASCAYCIEGEGEVAKAAHCSARCTVWAHAECFAKRHTFARYRHKHSMRTNGEAELCPYPECRGKLKGGDGARRAATATLAVKVPASSPAVAADRPLDDPSRPCAFLAKDGGPCRRTATKKGACRLHQRDAHVLAQMAAPAGGGRDVAVQTEESPLLLEIAQTRAQLAELQTAYTELSQYHATHARDRRALVDAAVRAIRQLA